MNINKLNFLHHNNFHIYNKKWQRTAPATYQIHIQCDDNVH